MKSPKAVAGSSVLAALAIGMMAAPAQGHRKPTLEIEVTYADLDLATKAADCTLARRVDAAVNSVCNEAASSDESTRLLCASQAWDLARPQLVRAERRAREIARTGASATAATAVTVKTV